MIKFKTLIVDDETHGRENLRMQLDLHCPELEIIGEASEVGEAVEMISTHYPDVVFLDILMPVHDGFNLLDHFPDRKFVVIFVSASVDYGIKAVKAGVLDYLLKPIEVRELQQAVNKVVSHFGSGGNAYHPDKVTRIALSHANGFNLEEIENIIRLQADDNYTKVFTISGKQYMISRPLKDFERALPAEHFVRTHKSYIINIRHLKNFSNEDGGVAILNDGIKVPISKRKNSTFFDALKKFSLMLRSG
jgi:two-component system LytT family response regulator